MMIRFLIVCAGILFLTTLGAFFLIVPLLSLAIVVCILIGLILMFGIGFQVGAAALGSDHLESLDRMRLIRARALRSFRALTARIKGFFSAGDRRGTCPIEVVATNRAT